jgi:hypothetical protein
VVAEPGIEQTFSGGAGRDIVLLREEAMAALGRQKIAGRDAPAEEAIVVEIEESRRNSGDAK